MHSRFGKRGSLMGGLLALALMVLVPSVATAGPEAGAKPRGFRLFARSLGAMTVNRIYCGLNATGEICVDSNNSSTIGGGFWPKGTADQYVFNSGLQIAGIIDNTDPSNPWAGDTTGGFFFDPKGTTQHGLLVQPIYNAGNPDDVANWPQAALVPQGDAGEDLFFPVLRGRVSASQGDVWFMSWEGDPGQNAGRPHPLGIVVEQRGMGWNYPTGNEDILYFVFTFYNATSLNEADYAAIRPGMREIIMKKAQDFHALNNAAFGVTLPAAGYTINQLFAGFGTDMDVGDAGDNYASVQLPFALGNTYESSFGQPPGWQFDPGIFAPPLFAGVGFVGTKYLKSPTGPGEIQLYSNTINGGVFGDAANTTQLWRYLSGNISQAAGDAPCAQGPPQVTRLCYINNGAKADMRYFQSSTPLQLAPGEFGSIVVAYIFAAPAKVASFTPTSTTDLKPGNPLRFASVDSLNTVGANMMDSLAGFKDFNDANGDGIAQQEEYTVVPGSLLGKALVAQQVFDSKFLLAFAPDSPEFFLVPGDNQVTVLWRPSATEQTGDPFFEIAANPTIIPEGGGAPVPNNLYDPNYRQFDVEGYRVYRGRVDAPSSLTLLAQFDYAGTVIRDFTGSINPIATCAPDIGIFTDCTVPYDSTEFQPGVERTVFNEVPLESCGNGPLIQVSTGGRVELINGEALITRADTAVTGLGTGYPCLGDTNVPFVYVDRTVRNNFRYFYSVTAFDVNSFASGPTSIESPRLTKSVTPRPAASNASSSLVSSTVLLGRGVTLNSDASAPAFDGANFTFAGPFPAANAWDAGFVGAVAEVLNGAGSFTIRLDSINLGNSWHEDPNVYYLTASSSAGQAPISISLIQSFVEPSVTAQSTPFAATLVDPSVSRFGGSTDFALFGSVTMTLPGHYFTNQWGRAAAFGSQTSGFPDINPENGPRWFDGSNETLSHPNAGYLAAPVEADPLSAWSNAGELAGVYTIHTPMSYLQGYGGVGTRQFNGMLGGAVRAADFKFYWGAAGTVDSVIDITHNVPVPFGADFGGGWGFMTPASAASYTSRDGNNNVVTYADFWCVKESLVQGNGSSFTCTNGDVNEPYVLVDQAVISPIQIGTNATRISAAPDPGETGFGLYMPGFVFIMGATALPAAGTVWTMRSYTGAIDAAGAFFEQPRTLSAVGAEIRVDYNANNAVNAPTLADLNQVHTVPDPYYITNEFEQSTDDKILKFVNLPDAATIRIYTSSGVLVDILEHNTNDAGGAETWNLRNRNNQVVASGVYFYHIEAGDARRVGRFTVVNFAQ